MFVQLSTAIQYSFNFFTIQLTRFSTSGALFFPTTSTSSWLTLLSGSSEKTAAFVTNDIPKQFMPQCFAMITSWAVLIPTTSTPT